MEELDILTLEDGKDYVIAKMLTYKNRNFLLLVEVDKDENLLNNKLVVEKISGDGEYLELIEDKKLYDIVSSRFAKMLLEDIK